MDGYFLASDTDLLINWLYNLSIDNNYYCIGAAISLIIFFITSAISLVVYIKSPSYREEEYVSMSRKTEKNGGCPRKNPRYRNDLSHIACSGVCILLSVPVADPCIVFQIRNDLFV